MNRKRLEIFAAWRSRLFTILLALLPVVACTGGGGPGGDVGNSQPPGFRAASCPPPAGKKLSECGSGNVQIGAAGCGKTVYVDKTQTLNGTITIDADGTLAFPNQSLELDTAGIIVGGTLSAGTALCPITNRITIKFTGKRPCPAPEDCSQGGTKFFKGIEVLKGGTLQLYGTKGVPQNSGVSWTYLSKPAGPEDKYAATDQDGKPTGVSSPVAAGGGKMIHLADDVSKGAAAWQAGDWIAVATTSFNPFETEFVQLSAPPVSEGSGSLLVIKQPAGLVRYHFGGTAPSARTSNPNCKDSKGKLLPASFCDGSDKNWGVDERAEVGLISRNIKLTSDASNADADPHWGGELKFLAGFKEVSIQGVEIEKFGKDELGSYPIHFHMDGDVGNKPLLDSNSIHHSYNKCMTVHSTKNLTISNNVCARVVGHIFYEEFGDEDGVKYRNNLGLGAMSNNFGLQPRKDLPFYWPGDNLTNDSTSPDYIGYDGLNIPNTDNQKNPTRGSCKRLPDSRRKDPPDPPEGTDLIDVGFPFSPTHPEACKSGNADPRDNEFYTEPASGFWLVNPGTELVGNSIGGCQAVGRAYWYVAPASAPLPANLNDLQFKPLGLFQNNRAHGCFAGLYDEGENNIWSQQLFPKVGGTNSGKNLIGTFDGFTATRIRDRGVWIRPMWYVIKNGRFATTRDHVSLVTSGGLDGNGPGVWSLLKDSVVVGISRNNVDRWGPCPKNAGDNFGCIEGYDPGLKEGNPKAQDVNSRGYQPPRWNSLGFLIYDGPVRIVHNRFVNFKKDISGLLTKADSDFLKTYTAYANGAGSYEGDAVFGWFNSNQSAYPTSTVSSELIFENTDLRHQIFTQAVNLAFFNDGDKNTAILDEDGTLAGFQIVDKDNKKLHDARQFPISLNNLEFNRSSNAVDECHSEGQQDAEAEDRPTSLMSPANMASLEFGALTPPRQDVTFTKDSLDYGAHQTMTLVTGRDGRGTWEPKVASGFGYTISAAQGVPSVVHLGLTDPVKPDIVAPTGPGDPGENPFFVRVGICFQSKNSPVHPADATKFTIKRGYRSWGGNGTSFNDSDLQRYFVHLDADHSFDGQHCINLDDANPTNLSDTAKGCPANGVAAAPKPADPDGGCPYPSSKQTVGSVGNTFIACVYPTSQLTWVGTIDELKTGGQPDPTKYFYDSAKGWLFFYVLQEFPNPIAGSPLGSCTADGSGPDDPACPDVAHKESFYACPAQGCVDYVVRLDDSTYEQDASKCPDPYPTYAQDPPVNQNKLAYVGAPDDGGAVVPVEKTSSKGFKHATPSLGDPSSCN